MIYPIANPTENQMIALANELYQLSGGMCQAGAGPYGIGVSKGFIGMAESPKYNIKYNINHINEIAKFLGCSPRDFLPEKPL